MPTYVYETIPFDPETPPRRFEVFQKMSEDPLQFDPKTKEMVRKIITSSFAMKRAIISNGRNVNKSSAAATACGCATGKPHNHHRSRGQSSGFSSQTHTNGHKHKK